MESSSSEKTGNLALCADAVHDGFIQFEFGFELEVTDGISECSNKLFLLIIFLTTTSQD